MSSLTCGSALSVKKILRIRSTFAGIVALQGMELKIRHLEATESELVDTDKPVAVEKTKTPLTCPRCDRDLDYVGTKRFHEGTRWGVLGDLGELFVNKEKFDVYCCPRCGRVEFFVDGVGEEFRQ